MKYFFLLLLGTCLIAWGNPQKLKHKVVIIGDSITDGYGIESKKAYPQLLQKKIQNKFPEIEIVPSAISGSVTASAHSRLTWLINNQKNITGVMIVLGGNDLLRGIKPQTIEKGYDKLITVANESKIPLLIATMPIPGNYSAYQKDLDSIYKKLSVNTNITILNDFLKGVIGVSAMNQTDGIHPNEIGHELIVKNISAQVINWIQKIPKEKK